MNDTPVQASHADPLTRWGRPAVELLILFGVWAFLLNYFKPEYIFLDTYPAGDDTPSFMHPVEHLRDEDEPHGESSGSPTSRRRPLA